MVFATIRSTAGKSGFDMSASAFPGANISRTLSVAERAGWLPLVNEPICR
jgi:hypothetical protein